jgi:hypothetical protein
MEKKPVKWSDIPKYGDLLTLQQWRDYCAGYEWADQMNSAYYALENKYSDEHASFDPKALDEIIKEGKYTHVMRFHK